VGAFVIVKLTLPSSVHVPNLKCLASFVTKKAKISTQKVPKRWFRVVMARSGSLKMVPFYRSHNYDFLLGLAFQSNVSVTVHDTEGRQSFRDIVGYLSTVPVLTGPGVE